MDVDTVRERWNAALDRVSALNGHPRWQVEEAFGYGGCAALALALAARLRLPILTIGDDDGYAHAFCALGNGLGLDIWGVRSLQEITLMWAGDDPAYRIESVDAASLMAMGGVNMEDIFRGMDREIAESFMPDDVLDEFTLSEFNCGACGDLAAVLHDMTGWPLRAEYDAAGDVAHIWVVNEAGQAVDINGVHAHDRAISPFSPARPGKIKDIARDEATADNRHSTEYREWAHSLITRHPERFGVVCPATTASPGM